MTMRSFPKSLRIAVAGFLVVHLSVLNVAPAAAGLAPSSPSGSTSITTARDADVLAVRRALEHKLVAQKLRDYGVSPSEVELRIASMSDEELHTLAAASRGLPSGSDALGTLVTVLLIILLVILILKLLNREIIVR
jgi:hypothetical protein